MLIHLSKNAITISLFIETLLKTSPLHPSRKTAIMANDVIALERRKIQGICDMCSIHWHVWKHVRRWDNLQSLARKENGQVLNALIISNQQMTNKWLSVMLKPGTLIDWKWHETLEGKEAFSSFFYHRGPHTASSPSPLNPSLTWSGLKQFLRA